MRPFPGGGEAGAEAPFPHIFHPVYLWLSPRVTRVEERGSCRRLLPLLPPPSLSLYTFFPPIRPLHPRIPSPEAKRASLESCRTEQESFSPFAAASLHGKGAPAKRGERTGEEKDRQISSSCCPLFSSPLLAFLSPCARGLERRTRQKPAKRRRRKRGEERAAAAEGGGGRAHRPRAPGFLRCPGDGRDPGEERPGR